MDSAALKVSLNFKVIGCTQPQNSVTYRLCPGNFTTQELFSTRHPHKETVEWKLRRMEESESMSESSSLDVSPDLMLFVFGVIQFSECFVFTFCLAACHFEKREIFLAPGTFMKEHGNATNHDSRVNMKTYLSFVAHNELKVNTAREMTDGRRGPKDVCAMWELFLMMICV